MPVGKAAASETMVRRRSLYILSPAPLILMAWLFMFAGVIWGYAARHDLPVLVRTMDLNGIGFDFPLIGILWTVVCLALVLVLGFATTRPIPAKAQVIGHPRDLSKAVTLAAGLHVVILIVVILWILLGARSVGGFGRLMALAAEQETYIAKDAILDNKLFPGMRLLYTGLVGLGLFGACVFAANLRSAERIRRDMRLGLGMFLASVVALSFLPIFLSQRILLIQMVLSTFVGVSMVSGRPFHFRYGALLGGLLFAVWSLREAVTVGAWASDYSAARIGAEKLLYYLVNDFYNAVTPIASEFGHTLGLYTFNFVVFFTPFQDSIYAALEERNVATMELRAGGVFPAFTAPYVDFSWWGILFVIALILLFTWVFNRAHRSFTFSLIYGQLGGAMLLMPHTGWYSHQNFAFNIVMLLVLSAFIGRRKAPASSLGGWQAGRAA